MGVFCQILINKPRGGSHRAGGPVTGTVKYTVDEPTQYKDIIISLFGKGKCSWSERRGKHTYYYKGKEDYTSQHLRLHEKGPGDVFILPIGTYERPFHFILPYNIPSSLQNNICNIKYNISLTFEKPSFFSINKKFAIEIYVIGNVHPVKPEGITVTELDKNLFTPFKKRKHHVNVQTEIPNTMFRPGNRVQVNYKVTNNTDVIIPSLKAELVCHTIVIANCGQIKKSSRTISECTLETASVPDNAVANLENIMPLPNYLYTIQNSRIISNEYRIKVTLKLPMPYINASMKIPIVIGYTHYDENGDLHIPESEELVGEPPSYFEVMNETKEKEED